MSAIPEKCVKSSKKLPSWILIYVGLIAVVVLSELDRRPAEPTLVSPVAAGQGQYALELNPVSPRSDL